MAALVFSAFGFTARLNPKEKTGNAPAIAEERPADRDPHEIVKIIVKLEDAPVLARTSLEDVRSAEMTRSLKEKQNSFDEDWNFVEVPCFSWTTSGNELRLSRMNTENRSLFGDLDLSGCEFLAFLQCSVNELTGIDVSDCTALDFLHCYGNDLSELIVSGCTGSKACSCRSHCRRRRT